VSDNTRVTFEETITDVEYTKSKFASVTNRVHIAWTQTGRQSIFIFTFSHTIYVKCKFLT